MPSLGVVLLLLLLGLVQSASANAACPPAVVPQNISQPHYEDITGGDAAGFITAFVRSFLNTVQPNPFPEGQYFLVNTEVPGRPHRSV